MVPCSAGFDESTPPTNERRDSNGPLPASASTPGPGFTGAGPGARSQPRTPPAPPSPPRLSSGEADDSFSGEVRADCGAEGGASGGTCGALAGVGVGCGGGGASSGVGGAGSGAVCSGPGAAAEGAGG
eukprot:CAMPEP_0172596590 /NCGR_PEP_ID=MMETSP1068-20121228/16419_1 /TAXON_ID=35684 /ORGANISM="Pseudopedinella elastica, Strain CCMP716" /LENGTH=127 /DNA_ID=CAMNT_0013395713 /DNA_START=246 /DNA_END=626 /DNA_ORIENTATION=+